MDDVTEFPKIPERGGKSQAIEAAASMIWTLLFLAYSSSTFVAEFGYGWPAAWTILLVILPVSLAGLPKVLDRHPRAIPVLLSYLLYAFIPSFLQLMQHSNLTSLASEITDLITVLAIWIPLQFKLLSKSLSPTGKVTEWGLLTAALNIVNIFLVLRPFSTIPNARDLGFSFKLSPKDLVIATCFGLLFAAIGIPLAIFIKFARFARPLSPKPNRDIPLFIGMYMSSLAEELLFRGVIQNMLEQRLHQNSVTALVITALAYAIPHLYKSKQGFDPPNIRFAILATISGLCSGITWRLTGKVTASAISHTVGDYMIWRLFTRNNRQVI